MAGPVKFKLPTGRFGASNLNPLSRKIVQLAFAMGGSKGKYFHATKCDYVFPDGRPCFNELRSDHDVDCPLCRGNGAYYTDAIDIPIIMTDSTNPISGDKYGATFDDSVTLTIPVYIDPGIVEVNRKGVVYIVKDKFAIYDHVSQLWGVFIANAEPFEPYLGGPLYRVVQATAQYTQRQATSYDAEPRFFFNMDERDMLQSINQDILGINGPPEAVAMLGQDTIIGSNGPIFTDKHLSVPGANLDDDWS